MVPSVGQRGLTTPNHKMDARAGGSRGATTVARNVKPEQNKSTQVSDPMVSKVKKMKPRNFSVKTMLTRKFVHSVRRAPAEVTTLLMQNTGCKALEVVHDMDNKSLFKVQRELRKELQKKLFMAEMLKSQSL